jgi:hypothetical protein
MRVSIPPRRYVNHIVLVSSICYLYNCFEEVMCDTLLDECDVWGVVPFWEPMVDFEIATCSNLQKESLFELQRDKNDVGENTFLIKRVCLGVTDRPYTHPDSRSGTH